MGTERREKAKEECRWQITAAGVRLRLAAEYLRDHPNRVSRSEASRINAAPSREQSKKRAGG